MTFTFTYINPALTPGSPSRPLRRWDQSSRAHSSSLSLSKRLPLCDSSVHQAPQVESRGLGGHGGLWGVMGRGTAAKGMGPDLKTRADPYL
ncbi:hypothetical protein D9758_013523 [Tetrapyrgos nigripes]|uniref:Uncharacterized protein n=1 Tax=Tetrapyrgos nigripes TaxID=182062 RepID=A0A8H5D1M1_9AGAR|nr:hypothetical protein D9758_013523 [Tetrapyrgos nigripes]